MASLHIVATPIGNLEDISARALRILAGVDLILAEDTRVTQKLLDRYGIKKPLWSYHQHSRLRKTDAILDLLRRRKNLALVSDAGTPGVSDPGNELVNLAIKQIGNLTITPIPGPSALAAAASVAGFPMGRFLFLGFPPAKNKRNRFFEEILDSKYPVVFYESKYKILKTLSELAPYYHSHGNDSMAVLERPKIVVCQELTKKFEKIYRGSLAEVLEQLKTADLRGEFVVIVQNPR